MLIKNLSDRKSKVVCGAHLAAHILNLKYQGIHLSPEEHSDGIQFTNTLAATNENFRLQESAIAVELAQYIAHTKTFAKPYLWGIVGKIDPVMWWQGYCSKTAIKDLAVSILTLPPSSAATERTFSRYSLVHTKRRNRLTAKGAGMRTHIACNLNLMAKESQRQGESMTMEVNQPQSLDPSTSTQTAPPLGDQVHDLLLTLESENSETDESNDEESRAYSVHDFDSNSSIGPESLDRLDYS
ncbi:uncharacterized protein LOC126742160 [Anthonomus grandis grandis]|uniref:uncharacterized protein LOC126742160 n=1 Tax=Anthonomus grandis grandis TaxID=2921223 RepID=UPI0021654C3D|nr:uncharacterized protein LOC126742160 [Anthonomus grandis grandis]